MANGEGILKRRCGVSVVPVKWLFDGIWDRSVPALPAAKLSCDNEGDAPMSPAF